MTTERDDFARIRRVIAQALDHEKETLALQGAVGSTVGFESVRNAIAAVPDRLDACAVLRLSRPASKRLRRVLADIIAYWDEADDILQDDGGLIGCVDDALVSHLLLARFYRWHLETVGRELTTLAGQSDLDLRRFLTSELAELISSAASEIWDRGFKSYRPIKVKRAFGIFATPNLASAPIVTRGQASVRTTDSESESPINSHPDGGRLYEVWFGTNRQPIDPGDRSKGYGGTRDEQIHYGVCEVAIPKSHRFGSVGTAWWQRWLRLDFADDHIKIVHRRSIKDAGSFFEDLRSELSSGRGNQLLFYLHGFNVSFDDAAIRAAQLFADLKTPGAAAFFSWPSKGSVDEYFADAERISESEAAIATFLSNLATQLGDATVHIIAHSMGNRGLARAIQRITSVAGESGVRFGQIILAAPDISVGLFHDLARIYPSLSARTTMYVSARDRALGLSRWLQDAPRAGFTPPVTIVPNVDTIEVSNIDMTMLGHGYYAEAEAVLYDISALLHNNVAPVHRPRLRPGDRADSTYWVIGA